MSKKVALVSFSGAIGKTTLGTHVLKPFMPEAIIFSIETVNETSSESGVESETIIGTDYRKLSNELLVLDEAIVDVGASNIEAFLAKMVEFDGSHEDFDIFLIPTVSGKDRQQKDAVRMAEALLEIGVDPKKIKFLFNNVQRDIENEFEITMNYLNSQKKIKFNPKIALWDLEMFSMLTRAKKTLTDVYNDQTDYRKALQTLLVQIKNGEVKEDAKSDREILRLKNNIALTRAVRSNYPHIEEVFHEIIG